MLVIRSSNDQPACVKPDIVQRLLTHEWITVEKFEAVHQIIQKNETSSPDQKQGVTNQSTIKIVQSEPKGIHNQTMNSKENNSTDLMVHEEIPPLSVIPKVSSTMPGVIKILSVTMSPNQLKVGDVPRFTVTYQNISDKEFGHPVGCHDPPFAYTILYSDGSQDQSMNEVQSKLGRDCEQVRTGVGVSYIQPEQNVTDNVFGYSTIKKPDTMTVTMNLPMSIHASYDLLDTIQFNVTAEQHDPPAESFTSSFESAGSGNSQLGVTGGIAIDSSNNIYIVDETNNRVVKFDSNGHQLLTFGSYGSGKGQFNLPENIAIDRSDNIYVTDRNNDRVEKFSSSGNYISQFSNGGGTNIAIDSSGNIYVLYSGDYVVKFDSHGNQLLTFGSDGSGNGQFENGDGLAIDALGNVYLGDIQNHRIQKFSSNGTYLAQFGLGHDWLSIPNAPTGIAIDSSGNFYVVDSGHSSVEKFSPLGKYLYQFGSEPDNGQLSRPNRIAIDSSDNIYVTESIQGDVKKFSHISS